MDKAITAIVHGRVQGVFFRDSTRQKAEMLGLTGWVRNQPDGTVALLAAGPEDRLQSLIEWLQVGPTHAVVAHVDVDWCDPPAESGGFEVRW